MVGIPTLPEIEQYDPQHLVSAARHWDETAQRWRDVMGEFHASAQGLDFHGRTATSVRDSAARQYQGAITDADKLSQAAAIAGNAADELRMARQRVLNLVEHAENNGFSVSPTYQVTDTSGSHNTDSAARQIAAQEMSADMVRAAGALYTHDAQTAGRMAQAVDFTTHGGDEFQMPPPGPAPAGKQWFWQQDTGWGLRDHLVQCDGTSVAGDVLSIAGGVVSAPGLPGPASVLAQLNAIRAITHLNGCEGP